MWSNISQSINIVAPVFLLVALGVWLKRKRYIDDHFMRLSTRLVFHIAMPSLVFVRIAGTHFGQVFNVRLCLFAYAAILCIFIFSWLTGIMVAADGRDRGAFVQGCFRGNFAILGFAMIQSAFGKESLANAAVLLTLVMPPYNLLSIVVLSVTQKKHKKITVWQTIRDIFTNPLILAALVAFPFSFLEIPTPRILQQATEQLAGLTLPLALIGIGGSLSFSSIRQDLRLASIASALKLIITPAIALFFAVRMAFSPLDIGVLFCFFASPAAIASYVMADAMGSNSRLAGNIILLSTLASAVTLAIGFFILKSLHLV